MTPKPEFKEGDKFGLILTLDRPVGQGESWYNQQTGERVTLNNLRGSLWWGHIGDLPNPMLVCVDDFEGINPLPKGTGYTVHMDGKSSPQIQTDAVASDACKVTTSTQQS